MQLALVRYKGRKRVGVLTGNELQLLPRPKQEGLRLHEILHSKNPTKAVHKLLSKSKTVNTNEVEWLPPIYRQEVWAAGVTYKRSQTARKEESKGAGKYYDLVYKADRPELFFKANPHRVVGHHRGKHGLFELLQEPSWLSCGLHHAVRLQSLPPASSTC